MNDCVFSPDRTYRYSLLHQWDELVTPRRLAMWIGLNPSTADEHNLDPTLRRVRAFSTAWGCNEFVMTNLFAFRSTWPIEMKRAEDPVGPDNDYTLNAWAARAEFIVCGWGTHGSHAGRAAKVGELLRGFPTKCLGLNADGSPKHPLYVLGTTPLVPWP